MILLLASIALAAPAGLSVGIPLEVDLVGRAWGVRPDLSYALNDRQTQHLRVALGLLPGRQYFFVPLSVGWRWTGRPERDWHPIGGAGVEAQSFWIHDGAPTVRSAFYADLGVARTVSTSLDVAVTTSPELTVFGVPGIGLSLRAGLVWTPGQTPG